MVVSEGWRHLSRLWDQIACCSLQKGRRLAGASKPRQQRSIAHKYAPSKTAEATARVPTRVAAEPAKRIKGRRTAALIQVACLFRPRAVRPWDFRARHRASNAAVRAEFAEAAERVPTRGAAQTAVRIGIRVSAPLVEEAGLSRTRAGGCGDARRAGHAFIYIDRRWRRQQERQQWRRWRWG